MLRALPALLLPHLLLPHLRVLTLRLCRLHPRRQLHRSP